MSAGIILNARDGVGPLVPPPAQDFSSQLEQALVTRPVIEQAKGVLIGAARCTAEEAFEQLVTVSQRHNIKLRRLAAALVAEASGSSDEVPDHELRDVVRSCWGHLFAQ